MKKNIIVVCTFLICCIILIGVFINTKVNGQMTGKKMEFFPVEVCYGNHYLYCIGRTYEENGGYFDKVYRINIENSQWEKIDQLEEDIFFPQKITIYENQLYIISYNSSLDTYQLCKFDGEEVIPIYNLDKNLKSEDILIKGFCITQEQVCYIREENNKLTLCIDLKTQKEKIIQDDIKNGFFESMTVGKNGCLYMLFCNGLENGGGYILYKIKGTDIEIENKGMLLPYDDLYSVMGKGDEKYDFYIKSINSLYGYNEKDKKFDYIQKIDDSVYEFTKTCFTGENYYIYMGMKLVQQKGKNFNYMNFSIIELSEINE